MSVPLVLLLTDYGTHDPYVGQLHLAVHRVAPNARVIDLSHAVEPQAVAQGAFLLWSLHAWLPEEAVVCAVVDPGVGTPRPMVAACRGEGPTYVAPDNGLLGFLRDDFPDCPSRDEPLELVRLERPEWWGPYRSATFHGRDILAPVATYLAQGTLLTALGPTQAEPPQACPGLWPDTTHLTAQPPVVHGRVLHVDRFGNALTNVPGRLLAAGVDWRLRWGPVAGAEEAPGPQTTFGDVAVGQPLWYVGSTGFVELAVNQGSAREQLALGIGSEVELLATERAHPA